MLSTSTFKVPHVLVILRFHLTALTSAASLILAFALSLHIVFFVRVLFCCCWKTRIVCGDRNCGKQTGGGKTAFRQRVWLCTFACSYHFRSLQILQTLHLPSLSFLPWMESITSSSSCCSPLFLYWNPAHLALRYEGKGEFYNLADTGEIEFPTVRCKMHQVLGLMALENEVMN